MIMIKCSIILLHSIYKRPTVFMHGFYSPENEIFGEKWEGIKNKLTKRNYELRRFLDAFQSSIRPNATHKLRME